MPIRYVCLGCREELELPDDKAGQLCSCPRCRLKFLAPPPSTSKGSGRRRVPPSIPSMPPVTGSGVGRGIPPVSGSGVARLPAQPPASQPSGGGLFGMSEDEVDVAPLFGEANAQVGELFGGDRADDEPEPEPEPAPAPAAPPPITRPPAATRPPAVPARGASNAPAPGRGRLPTPAPARRPSPAPAAQAPGRPGLPVAIPTGGPAAASGAAPPPAQPGSYPPPGYPGYPPPGYPPGYPPPGYPPYQGMPPGYPGYPPPGYPGYPPPGYPYPYPTPPGAQGGPQPQAGAAAGMSPFQAPPAPQVELASSPTPEEPPLELADEPGVSTADPPSPKPPPRAGGGRPVGFRLLALDGLPEGTQYDLPGGKVYLIGRDKQADIPILSTSVSRRQARIDATGSSPVLIDLGSANGTQVNGESVDRHPLRDGDLIKMGTILFRYQGA